MTLAQVFSCEFWEICKNIFFIENFRWLLLSMRLWTTKIAFTITIQMAILHFLALSMVLNRQHKWIINYYVEQTPPDVQWRERKPKLSRTWKGKFFFIYLSFRIAFLFCLGENVLFSSFVACYYCVICSCRKACK